MQDILIVYDSKTGNTEKVAKALAEAAGERALLCRYDEAPNADGFSVVFVGYWVDRGMPNANMKQYLPMLKNKKVVLFQTLGAEPKSEHALACVANAGKLLDESNSVLGALSFRGAIDPQLIAMMRKMPAGSPHAPTPETEARWAAAASHPDAQDLQEARDYMAKFLYMFERFYKNM